MREAFLFFTLLLSYTLIYAGLSHFGSSFSALIAGPK